MNSVWCEGTQTAGTPTMGSGCAVGSGSVVQGCRPGFPWVRTGKAAAAMAAGLVEVWSSIRLLMVRGCESKTKPFFCAYDEDGIAGLPGPKKPAAAASAALNVGSVNR